MTLPHDITKLQSQMSAAVAAHWKAFLFEGILLVALGLAATIGNDFLDGDRRIDQHRAELSKRIRKADGQNCTRMREVLNLEPFSLEIGNCRHDR